VTVKGLPASQPATSASPSASENSNNYQAFVAASAPQFFPLLALTLEIRLEIYRYALQGRLVLFDQSQKRYNKSQDNYQNHYYDEMHDEYAGVFKWSAGLCNLSGDPDLDTGSNGDGELLGLQSPSPEARSCRCQNVAIWQVLCVCHQVYFEALPIFYHLTKFSFSSPRHFWNFYVKVDKKAPLLEDCNETQGWYNTSIEAKDAPSSS
jgi:hypothetical protein